MGPKRHKRWIKVLLAAVLVLGLTFAVLHFPVGPVKIQISPQTTVITGPLNPDGTVNYLAALDGIFADGVTAQNNAAPDLLQVFGPSMLPQETRDEVLRRLGLTPADIGQGLFVKWQKRTRPATRPAVESEPTFRTSGGANIPLSDLSLGEVWDMLSQGRVHPDLDGWLRANADALEVIRQTTAAKPRFYIPLVSTSNPANMFDPWEPNVTCCMHAAWTLACRALLRSRHGDPDGAWADVLTAHRLARLVGQSPIVMHQLVAMITERTAAETGTILATSGALDIQRARSLLAEVGHLRPVGNTADCADRELRFMALDAIMMLSRGRKVEDGSGLGEYTKNASNLDWNEMLREANKWCDLMAKPLHTPRFAGRAEAKALYEDRLRRFEAQMDGKGFRTRLALLKLGGWLCRPALSRECANLVPALMLPDLGGAMELQDHAMMTHSVETTAVALACYRAEKGRWPSTLSELSPAYLKTVPMDAFSQGPLVYRANDQGYVLYSIGRNQRDDGGTWDLKGDKDDIVARVPAGQTAGGTTTGGAGTGGSAAGGAATKPDSVPAAK